MQWTGQFHFGDCWAAYRGPAGDTAPHAHAALQIALAIDGEVLIQDSRGVQHGSTGLLVRSGAEHTLLSNSDVVVLLCDPDSPAASELKSLLTTDDIVALPARYMARFDLNYPLSDLMRDFSAPVAPALDPRLQQAMRFMDERPGATLADIARHCDLSPSRLRGLAQAELGVPLARWRSWRSLRRSALAMAKGASLADAALAGGFADQSHFSRTMRRMTGLTPSAAPLGQ